MKAKMSIEMHKNRSIDIAITEIELKIEFKNMEKKRC
jgi:hypothetical protein